MPELDAQGEALRHRLADRATDLFEPVPPCSGRDSRGLLRLTVDSARRVTDVSVQDIGALRRPASLERAVREAFAAADGERALASLRSRDLEDVWLERAERRMAGAPLKVRSAPDVSYAGYLDRGGRSRPHAPAPPVRPPAPGFVTCDNGYLSIRRSADGLVDSVRADADWLGGATVHHLAAAIDQAVRWPEEVPA